MPVTIGRREFIATLGGAAACSVGGLTWGHARCGAASPGCRPRWGGSPRLLRGFARRHVLPSPPLRQRPDGEETGEHRGHGEHVLTF